MGTSHNPSPVYSGTWSGNTFTPTSGSSPLPVSVGSSASAVVGGGCSQIPVATSTTQLVAADTAREYLSFQNDGTTDCYVNHSAAATLSTKLLRPGEAMVWQGPMARLAWHAISSSGTNTFGIVTGTV